MCEAESNAAINETLDFKDALNKIQFEHTLINHRVSWMFTSQGFLIAAYFAIRNNIGGTDINDSKHAILNLIVVTAACMAIMFYASIMAAHVAIEKWRALCNDNKKFALTSNRLIHYFGDAPSSIIGLFFVGFWLSIWTIDKKPILPMPEITGNFPLRYC